MCILSEYTNFMTNYSTTVRIESLKSNVTIKNVTIKYHCCTNIESLSINFEEHSKAILNPNWILLTIGQLLLQLVAE